MKLFNFRLPVGRNLFIGARDLLHPPLSVGSSLSPLRRDLGERPAHSGAGVGERPIGVAGKRRGAWRAAGGGARRAAGGGWCLCAHRAAGGAWPPGCSCGRQRVRAAKRRQRPVQAGAGGRRLQAADGRKGNISFIFSIS